MDQCSDNVGWLARSFDLKNAYRQCAVHPSSIRFSYIVVGDPNAQSLKVFRLKAHPFGSVKSVQNFVAGSAQLVVNHDVFVQGHHDKLFRRFCRGCSSTRMRVGDTHMSRLCSDFLH